MIIMIIMIIIILKLIGIRCNIIIIRVCTNIVDNNRDFRINHKNNCQNSSINFDLLKFKDLGFNYYFMFFCDYNIINKYKYLLGIYPFPIP